MLPYAATSVRPSYFRLGVHPNCTLVITALVTVRNRLDYRIESQWFGPREAVIVTLSGSADAASILALLSDLDGRRPAFVLLDETALKVGLIGPADIQRIAQRWGVAEHLRTAVIGIVAPNPVIYGLNRMFQLIAETGSEMRVFTSRPDAMVWLGAQYGAAR